jgi:hypothetical protein
LRFFGKDASEVQRDDSLSKFTKAPFRGSSGEHGTATEPFCERSVKSEIGDKTSDAREEKSEENKKGTVMLSTKYTEIYINKKKMN